MLQGEETRYQKIEKATLALIEAKIVFQSHPVVVKTNLLIKQILRKLDLARRMVGWAIKLSEFDITFEK
ncbi:hypothetical protein CR513_54202, partial [Mucuna pruriens]